MARPSSVTTDQLEAIRSHRAEGVAWRKIAALVGVSEATCRRVLKPAKEKQPRKGYSVVSSDEIEKMSQLLNEGHTYAEIGRLTGRSTTVVMKKLNETYASDQRKACKQIWDSKPKAHKRTPEEQLQHRRDYRNAWHARDKQNPAKRMIHNLRSLMAVNAKAYKINKNAKTPDLFGMSFEDWAATQDPALVEAWMNEGNAVHMDHIRPIVSFDTEDPEQMAICWNWRNFQLLSKSDNTSKRDNWDRADWEAMMTAKGWSGKLF